MTGSRLAGFLQTAAANGVAGFCNFVMKQIIALLCA